MSPKKAYTAKDTYPAGWIISTDVTVNGRHITPGTEVSIKGERGRFRFIKAVTNSSGSTWLDFYGPHRTGFRSFGIDRVVRVHRIDRTRENAA